MKRIEESPGAAVRARLGRYVTYHKSGAVSFRLSEFLQSQRGMEQMQHALEAASLRSQVKFQRSHL